MKQCLLSAFFFLCIGITGTFAQQRDTSTLVFPDTTLTDQQLDSLDKVIDKSVEPDVETRAERRARRKAEKEREKYYYKGILKDSARLEIERVGRQAWRRSVFVPGWGQYTNGGLWWVKVPIIYGGLVTGYIIFDYWNYYYREFLGELQYRYNHNGNPNPDGIFANASVNEQYLIRQRDWGRRNRDLTVLATLAWYGLNVVEAYTDSMLRNRWNISDDLAFKLNPTILPNYALASPSFGGYSSMFAPGLKLTIKIK